MYCYLLQCIRLCRCCSQTSSRMTYLTKSLNPMSKLAEHLEIIYQTTLPYRVGN